MLVSIRAFPYPFLLVFVMFIDLVCGFECLFFRFVISIRGILNQVPALPSILRGWFGNGLVHADARVRTPSTVDKGIQS